MLRQTQPVNRAPCIQNLSERKLWGRGDCNLVDDSTYVTMWIQTARMKSPRGKEHGSLCPVLLGTQTSEVDATAMESSKIHFSYNFPPECPLEVDSWTGPGQSGDQEHKAWHLRPVSRPIGEYNLFPGPQLSKTKSDCFLTINFSTLGRNRQPSCSQFHFLGHWRRHCTNK